MRQRNHIFVGFMMVFSLVLAFGPPARAAEFPTRPINLIIPWPAGGAGDIVGRTLAEVAKKELGQPIIVDNKPGAGGNVGTTLILTKPADGYTLGDTSTNAQIVSYYTGLLNYHPLHDCTHIMRAAGMLYGLVVRADSPWKTFKEFIEYSKANPQKVSFGSPGLTTAPRLAMEELASMAGNVQWIHVPLKGEAETNASLLGGHVDAIANSGWAPLVDAGKLRVLALFGPRRVSRFPQVPTVKELGYDVVWEAPVGFFGPKGLPKPIVKKLNDALRKGIDDPTFQSAMKRLEMAVTYLDSEETEKAVRREAERIEGLVKRLGLDKKKE
jgi:tripartite-type tricarboxylate transporter receptor subunit TctC